MTTQEEIKDKFRSLIPHLQYAVEMAKKERTPGLAITYTREDNSGRIICQFRAEEFLEDLVALIGAPPLSEESRLDARAKDILDHAERGVIPWWLNSSN
jgi:hypothetical protein